LQRIVLLIVILAVIGGVYMLLSQPDDSGGGTDPLAENGDVAEGGTAKKNDPAALSGSGTDPDEVLVPQMGLLRKPARVLMVAQRADGWNTFLSDSLKRLQDLSFVTWHLASVTPEGIGAAGPGDSLGLDALKAPPTGDYLEREDIHALIWDTADPNTLPASFWKVVAERVNSGRMGLYIRPGTPPAPAGSSVMPPQHPALTHPVLKDLLPVARASLIQGSPLPGIYSTAQPLVVTPEGSKHVATRLVKNTAASLKTWAQTGEGAGAFATRFCYPVQEMKAGAKALVNLQAATALPAIIVSGAQNARVLWMGNIDFGREAYYVRSKDAVLRFLTNGWLLWLVGQAPE
jgi:hypothetical protein